MQDELVGKLIALNSFELRNRPNINIGDVSREQWMEYNRRQRILESDVDPVVAALAPGTFWAMYSEDGIKVESQYSKPRTADVTAIEGQYFQIKKLAVVEGRQFTPDELTTGASVVILGPDLVKRLFPTVTPIDHDVKIAGKIYKVIGVGESRGSAFGQSFYNYIFAPFRSPVHRLLNRAPHVIYAVIVQVSTTEALKETEERLRKVIRGTVARLAKGRLHPRNLRFRARVLEQDPVLPRTRRHRAPRDRTRRRRDRHHEHHARRRRRTHARDRHSEGARRQAA
jgi:putative ABC transport system permease protein